MVTTMSSKGQIVIPYAIRRRLGLQAGDRMDAEANDEQIILRLKRKPVTHAKIVRSKKTGLPCFVSASKERITSKMVADALADFP